MSNPFVCWSKVDHKLISRCKNCLLVNDDGDIVGFVPCVRHSERNVKRLEFIINDISTKLQAKLNEKDKIINRLLTR